MSSQRCRLAALALLILPVVVLFVCDPARATFYPRCLFHEWTGLHCPGCGSLRALHHLLHGRIGTALGFNPLMVASLPWLLYLLSVESGLRLRGQALPRLAVRSGWIRGYIGLVLAYWVLRNLPYYPFTLLAP
ncbi:MAG: DUF2752 domain-containing protein [Isosphaeraceae bacterium]|nr:DUF2752 domain-containing protein [Isosphaeraceae bacterium]